MERGNNYLITYHNMNDKKILAMFLEEYNDMYLFKNIHGEFAITKKKIDNHEISLELIEDWIISWIVRGHIENILYAFYSVHENTKGGQKLPTNQPPNVTIHLIE